MTAAFILRNRRRRHFVEHVDLELLIEHEVFVVVFGVVAGQLALVVAGVPLNCVDDLKVGQAQRPILNT